MKKIIAIFLSLTFSVGLKAQSFSEFINELPELNLPVKWSEESYLDWEQVTLPPDLFNEIDRDLSKLKGIGKVNLGEYYFVLSKKYYNDDTDFLISGLLYKSNGVFCSSITLMSTSSGGKIFRIEQDYTLKIMSIGASSGYLSTYSIQNDNLENVGSAVYFDDASSYMRDEDSQ